MQSETLITGIGGQGIQLAARTLALGALRSGREVQYTSEVGGEMRGGVSTATLVVGTSRLRALPVVPTAGSLVAMHDRYWPSLSRRIRPGGVVMINSTLWEAPRPEGFQVVEIPATRHALDTGAPMTASLVIIGAFAALTGLAPVEALCAAMESSIPAYRRQSVAANLAAIRFGASLVAPLPEPLLPPTGTGAPNETTVVGA
ncbi:conserved hypothetical protein [Frankia canadensis]|uniref:Pyruvate/ketoisovalerate oxidoreductase catalytic domain-containing protein n=1 Tax=Frankia canadensis TaxID=1836972 RepID=A0A2I2L2V5_9ACTN|nr:2-oxoacid:acceptor oxidoreductase family protein [Frankia canadensis]SNQ52249.1 conserved hypothetical protein [Frankia canadensis]SOU59539.1 conserved hypothetical protein [Frankia canadensis]